jgi:cyanophycinase
MKAVLHTPVYDAIHFAYDNGSVVAGTSAGAAVMSKHMITGNQLRGDTEYHATFDRIWNKNIEFEEGLGLVDSTIIIDQHFVVRSRYNRMISALESYPTFTCIGIDESTAIIVHQKQIKVAGESQVIVMLQPKNIRATSEGLIKFDAVNMRIYTSGDSFTTGK